MQYAVVGATYQDRSLAVFHAGLTDGDLTSYKAAERKAIHLLMSELSASPLADMHDLTDGIVDVLAKNGADLQALAAANLSGLSISWFEDEHALIAAMDKSEAFQFHLEVVPIQ